MSTRKSAYRNMRILTIEDEPAIRSGIAAYLEDSGYEMLQASDGTTGIQMFRHEHPDAVLCDLRLPGADGLEVLSIITKESPETPVIVVSGASRVGDAVQAIKRGAWDYVTKPITEMELLEKTLCRVLTRAEQLQEQRIYREYLESTNLKLSRTVKQLQEEEQAGKAMQAQLMPPPQRQFGDYKFDSRIYPSTSLSGDFVDYFAIDDRYVGFYMADVSGHGAASAFITVILTTLISQYRQAGREEQDPMVLHPERTLVRLNRDLCRQQLDKYLTMFYGVIDRQNNTLTYSNGGQFPYPIIRNEFGISALAHPSRPVGLFEDVDYPLQTLALPAEFTMWLVSDGFLELMPNTSLKEKQAALQGLASDPALTLEDLESSVGLPDIKSNLPDDVTIFRIQRCN